MATRITHLPTRKKNKSKKKSNSKIILGFITCHLDPDTGKFIANPREYLAKRAHIGIDGVAKRMAMTKKPDKMNATIREWFVSECGRLCRDGEPNPIRELLGG